MEERLLYTTAIYEHSIQVGMEHVGYIIVGSAKVITKTLATTVIQ